MNDYVYYHFGKGTTESDGVSRNTDTMNGLYDTGISRYCTFRP